MKILGVDTSTILFSICLCEDDNVLYEIRKHRLLLSENRDGGIFKLVDNLINSQKHSIDAIALTIGPGLYTSLRVGLALAKGLYLSRNIPVFGINTFDVIAKSIPLFDCLPADNNDIVIAAVIDAFQKEVFVAFYSNQEKISRDFIFTPSDFVDYIEQNFKDKKIIMVVGPGSAILKENEKTKIYIRNHNKIIFLNSDSYYPSAAKVVKIALPRIKNGKSDDPELLEPYYIRKSDAEIKILK